VDETPSERAQPERSEDARAVVREAPAERYGPVVLERRLKEDGRALVLYTLASSERS
jgi:hypothetical protein